MGTDNIQVVLPFHEGDASLALDLLTWINELSESRRLPTTCFLLYPSRMEDPTHILVAATNAFESTNVLKAVDPPESETWPLGANWLFHTALKSVRGPFLFLEPDSVPMKRDWYTQINMGYNLSPSTFFGSVNTKGRISHLSGVAVYGFYAYRFYQGYPWNKPFDMVNQEKILQYSRPTKLIYNFWGNHDQYPIFKKSASKDDPINVMIPEQIPPETVLFHRDKTHSLIHILRERLK